MDLIDRRAAIDAVSDCGICIQRIVDLPSVKPEAKDCWGCNCPKVERYFPKQPERKNTKFEESIHSMFDHIWDCEIDHPIFQDTVGDLMTAVIHAFNNIFDNNYCVPLHTADMRGEQE